MTDFLLQLGAVELEMDGLSGGDFGQVLQQLDFGQGARGDLPRLAGVRSDVPRTFSFSATLSGVTKDAASAAVNAANRALSVTNTLVVRSKNAAESVTFRTFPSGSVKQLPASEWELSNWQTVQVSITVEPYAYGAPIVDTHAAVSTPGKVALTALGGEYPAPLTIGLTPTTGGEKLHSVYVALNEHPEWLGWFAAASGQTWYYSHDPATPIAPVADASAYGGYAVPIGHATSYAQCDYDVTGVPPGEYLVMLRVKMQDYTSGPNAVLSVGGYSRWSCEAPGDTAGVPTDIWRWYEVAELALPYGPQVRGSGVSTLPLRVVCPSSTYHAHADGIALLPTRAGFQSWHGRTDLVTGAGSWQTSIWFDASGAVYTSDYCDLTDATGSPIRALEGELLVLCDESVGADPTTNLDMTLMQTPRYSLYR